MPTTDPDDAALQRLLEASLGSPFFDGNAVAVLRNGVQIFPAMLDAIEAAQRSIDFLTFVYWRGEIAIRFADALAARARAGVRTRVLLDAVGARHIADELIRTMKTAGVDVQWLRPVARWKFWQLDHRSHRKILVCDDRVGFTGGVGIASEWEGDARSPDEWRETHFRIDGPAVRGLQAAFLDNWLEANRSGFPEMAPEVDPAAGATRIQVIRSSARVGWSDAATFLHVLIRAARRRIRITTAYFVPDEHAVRALVGAAERGVDVRILVPGPHVDARLSQLGGQDRYADLLRGGVRILQFQPTMIHAKVMTVDGRLAGIGSVNFNRRSIVKDDEIALSVLDTDVAARLDDHFEQDCLRAREIKSEDWAKRGPWQSVQELLVRLVRPQT